MGGIKMCGAAAVAFVNFGSFFVAFPPCFARKFSNKQNICLIYFNFKLAAVARFPVFRQSHATVRLGGEGRGGRDGGKTCAAGCTRVFPKDAPGLKKQKQQMREPKLFFGKTSHNHNSRAFLGKERERVRVGGEAGQRGTGTWPGNEMNVGKLKGKTQRDKAKRAAGRKE